MTHRDIQVYMIVLCNLNIRIYLVTVYCNHLSLAVLNWTFSWCKLLMSCGNFPPYRNLKTAVRFWISLFIFCFCFRASVVVASQHFCSWHIRVHVTCPGADFTTRERHMEMKDTCPSISRHEKCPCLPLLPLVCEVGGFMQLIHMHTDASAVCLIRVYRSWLTACPTPSIHAQRAPASL